MEKTLWVDVDGLSLAGVLHLPDGPPRAVIIGCHGLMADKASPKQIELARRCAAHGMAYFRFDHRGCGQSEGNFATDTTLANRRSDLLAAARCVDRYFNGKLPTGLFGSSLGGTVCLTAAPVIAPFAMVTLAAPVKHRNVRLPADSPASLKSEIIKNHLRFDISRQLSSIGHILIVHGSRDQTVDPQNADLIHRLCAPPKKLLWLEDGDHRISNRFHQEQFLSSSEQWLMDCYLRQFGSGRPG